MTTDLERALAEIDKVIALEPRWPSGHVLSAQLLPAEARAIRAALAQRAERMEAEVSELFTLSTDGLLEFLYPETWFAEPAEYPAIVAALAAPEAGRTGVMGEVVDRP